MLLTLDLATVLGWTKGAVSDTKFESGYFRLPSTGRDIGAFAAAYDEWLSAMLMNVTELCFEAPVLPVKTQLMTVRKLGGLCWHTEWLTTTMGVKCFECHLQSVKKTIGGHGRASKPDMISAVRGYGYDVTEENEADAIAVRLYTILTRHRELAADFGLELGSLGTTRTGMAPNVLRRVSASQLLGPEE